MSIPKTLRQQILKKTNGGLNIYSWLLMDYRQRTGLPQQTILHLVGRDCGICLNPFAGGAHTFHVYIERAGKDCWEQAYHESTDGSIPPGDAFDFARAYYRLNGQDLQGLALMRKINEDAYCHLTITDDMDPYEKPTPEFSFFYGPITNVRPYETYNLLDAYHYIRGKEALQATYRLRQITDENEAKRYKARHFNYCTFSGIFTQRNEKYLEKHSGLICVDFDDLPNPRYLKERLLEDEYFETMLLFVSPSGNGLKWVIPTQLDGHPDAEWFRTLANYIRKTYGVEIDTSCKDVARACFLPHDPNVHLHPELKKHENQ